MTWSQTLFFAAPLWSIDAAVARLRGTESAQYVAAVSEFLAVLSLIGSLVLAAFGL